MIEETEGYFHECERKILFIGIGNSGCHAVDELSTNGYDCLAIHADYNLEKEISCPQLNMLRNHLRPDEYPGFTNNPENIKLLVEENKDVIKDIITEYFQL